MGNEGNRLYSRVHLLYIKYLGYFRPGKELEILTLFITIKTRIFAVPNKSILHQYYMVIMQLYSFEYLACHSLFQRAQSQSPPPTFLFIYLFFPVRSVAQPRRAASPKRDQTPGS